MHDANKNSKILYQTDLLPVYDQIRNIRLFYLDIFLCMVFYLDIFFVYGRYSC